jgi:hypothetical protein
MPHPTTADSLREAVLVVDEDAGRGVSDRHQTVDIIESEPSLEPGALRTTAHTSKAEPLG